MNRPYRDDEELQRKRVLKALEDAGWAVQNGSLEEAWDYMQYAERAVEVLESMVTEFDEAREAEE